MQAEKWKQVMGQIKDTLPVLGEGQQHLDDEGGVDIEFIEFTGPIGKMRLEFVSKPAILDKKTHYSNRIGSETKIDYIYSDTEKSQIMTAYKWDEAEDDWIEVDASMFE